MPTRDGAVIVFDGVCVLCNGWVRFLLRHDRAGRYRFAAMQSARGRGLLAAHGLDPDDPASFLLVEQGRAFVDTDAIRRVLARTRRRLAHRAIDDCLVPRALRDPMYRCDRAQSLPLVRAARCLPAAAAGTAGAVSAVSVDRQTRPRGFRVQAATCDSRAPESTSATRLHEPEASLLELNN